MLQSDKVVKAISDFERVLDGLKLTYDEIQQHTVEDLVSRQKREQKGLSKKLDSLIKRIEEQLEDS